jgi:hypothetical protein
VSSLACAALALAGCGGGQLAGSSASAPTTTTPATTTPATSVPRTVATRPRHARTQPSQRPPTTTAPAHTTSTAPPPASTTSTAPAHATPTTTATTPSGPATHVVDEHADVTLVQRLGPLHYIQHGHVSGTIAGEMTLETKPSELGGIVTFTLTVASGGTVTGRGVVTPVITAKGKLKPVSGHARITGGTGPYAKIAGHDLVVSGKAALDGSQGVVRLTGVVTY